eukprot:Colp12_sorted_trinity150504_noHs@750
MVLLWAFRLGSFLFTRILKDGRDTRFEKIKPNPVRFLVAWTIQGLWVFLTALPVYIVDTSANNPELSAIDYAGWAIWVVGWLFEVVADRQKSAFRADPKNKNKFITTGLWSISRHPNYFGEIVLWWGIFIAATPVLQGFQYLAILSPLFVMFLLNRVSGVPLLEKKADKEWGDNPEYKAYKQRTPVLIPFMN